MLSILEDSTININITRFCNLRCEHCYMEKEVRENKKIMNIKDIYKIIDDSKEFYKNKENIKEITFNIIGGEILFAENDYLMKIINKIKSTDFNDKSIKIKTISSLLNKEIEKYEEYFSNVDLVGTSFDLDIKRFNSKNYELWKSNIKYLQNKNVVINCNITITKKILGREKEILEELFKNNIFSFHFGYFVPYLDKTNINLMPTFEESSEFYINVHKYILEYQNFNKQQIYYSPFDGMLSSLINNTINESTICEMLSSFNINTDGNVGICDAFGGKINLPDNEIVGNIFKNNLNEIENSSKYKKLFFNTMKINPICLNCEFQKQCYGSCRILEKYHDRNQKDCFGFKNFWQYTKNFLNENKI